MPHDPPKPTPGEALRELHAYIGDSMDGVDVQAIARGEPDRIGIRLVEQTPGDDLDAAMARLLPDTIALTNARLGLDIRRGDVRLIPGRDVTTGRPDLSAVVDVERRDGALRVVRPRDVRLLGERVEPPVPGGNQAEAPAMTPITVEDPTWFPAGPFPDDVLAMHLRLSDLEIVDRAAHVPYALGFRGPDGHLHVEHDLLVVGVTPTPTRGD
jgi:hypothetical protein